MEPAEEEEEEEVVVVVSATRTVKPEVISLVEEDEEEEEAVMEEKVKDEGKSGMASFRGYTPLRQCFYLKVGETTVLPLILLLHDSSIFSDLMLQELLSILRETLPFGFGTLNVGEEGTISAKYLDFKKPEVCRGDKFSFTYQLRPTLKSYCVMKKSEESGKYRGFSIFKYTLFVETIPPGEAKRIQHKEAHAISHYFKPLAASSKKKKIKQDSNVGKQKQKNKKKPKTK